MELGYPVYWRRTFEGMDLGLKFCEGGRVGMPPTCL
jgi:hypothetical protein